MKEKLSLSLVIAALLISGSLLYANYHSFFENQQATAMYLWQRLEDLNVMKIYHDPIHGFRISYPVYLTPSVDDLEGRYIVSFVAEQDSWAIAVIVSSTTASSAQAWVEEYNGMDHTRILGYTHKVRIDQELTLDGNPAIIVHSYDDFPGGHEEYTYEKRMLIVKTGKLFNISARTANPEGIWNSFRFEE